MNADRTRRITPGQRPPKVNLPVVLSVKLTEEAVGQFDAVTHHEREGKVVAERKDGEIVLSKMTGEHIMSLNEDQIRELLRAHSPAPVYR